MADFVFDDCELQADFAQKTLDAALSGADDGELFVERGTSESLTLDDGRLKTASFDTSRGFGLRCVAGETTGFAQGTDMSRAALTRAANAVVMTKAGYDGTLSLPPQRTNTRLYGDIDPVASPDFGGKVAILQEIDAFCRALDPSVVQVSATLSGSRRNIAVLRAGGARFDDIRPLVRLNISITAEKNGRRETGFAGAGGRQPYESFIADENWQAMAREALRQAQVPPRASQLWMTAPCPACAAH